MELNFTGKKAVVTGGSRGIGRAIAEVILKGGGEVLITSTTSLPLWLKEYPRVRHHHLDFLDEKSIEWCLQAIAVLGHIDVLVNNAGIHCPQPIDEVDKRSWDEVLRINLYGPMLFLRAAAPIMKAKRSGRVVNISSISGLISRPGGNAYSASKAGLLGLTRAAALDLAPFNILVNAVCPGVTETEMFDRVLTPEQKEIMREESVLKRVAKPEEIAYVAAFLCSDLNTYITGQTIVVDGGTTIQ